MDNLLPALRTEHFYKVCPLGIPVSVDLVCYRTMAEVRDERQLAVSVPEIRGMTLAQARVVRAALDQVIEHAEELIKVNGAKPGDLPDVNHQGKGNP